MTLHGGVSSTTTEVWEMLSASREGDLDGIRQLLARRPQLSTCQFNYTPPLHFALREGHLPLVRVLVEHKALDPTWAQKKGHAAVAGDLSAAGARLS